MSTHPSHPHRSSVIWTPNSSNTLIDTRDWFRNPFQFFSAGISQEFCLLQDLIGRQFSHTDGFLTAVDIVAPYDRMTSWARRHSDFDFRVSTGELRQIVSKKSVHSLGTPGPIAVVEIEPLAL